MSGMMGVLVPNLQDVNDAVRPALDGKLRDPHLRRHTIIHISHPTANKGKQHQYLLTVLPSLPTRNLVKFCSSKVSTDQVQLPEQVQNKGMTMAAASLALITRSQFINMLTHLMGPALPDLSFRKSYTCHLNANVPQVEPGRLV